MVFFFSAIFIFFGSMKLFSQGEASLTAYKIMEKVYDNSNYHKTKILDITMIISDERGRERKKAFKCYRKLSETLDNSLIRLYYPPDNKNMGVLTKSVPGRSEKDQWLYVHFSRTMKQLIGKAKKGSFLGSHFSYSDIGGRKLGEDDYRRLPDQKGYLVVESRPIVGEKNQEDRDYDRLVSYIDPKRFVIISQVYYAVDSPHKVLKVLTNKKIVKRDGAYIVILSEMVDGLGKGKTVVQIDEQSLQLGVEISDQQVGLKGLRFA